MAEMYKEAWRQELRKKNSPKDRMAIERVTMPETEVSVRTTSQRIEVNTGISAEAAQIEAVRCLDCPNPTCMSGCPVSINIPTFIKNIESGGLINGS